MPSQLGRNLESVLKNIQLNDILPLKGNVPVDPSQFYSSFGFAAGTSRLENAGIGSGEKLS